MPIELRLPNINALSEKEQLAQIRSYLYQFVPQLQWALNNMTPSSATMVTPTQNQVVVSGASSAPAPETTFNAIKSLIIKSADIVDAYYTEINNRLSGLYVEGAVFDSVFGTYTEETSQKITENSTRVERAFENIQTITSDILGAKDKIEGVKGDIDSVRGDIEGTRAEIDSVRGEIGSVSGAIDSVKEEITEIRKTEAYITTGIIDTDENGFDVYGVEIKQRNTSNGAEVFNKFARFTAGKLTFYNQEREVAWISDYILHIYDIEVLNTLKLGNPIGGRYELDTSNGLILQWVEGE